jgi:TfoX/Sxy family transcriptional regulator of competence genes
MEGGSERRQSAGRECAMAYDEGLAERIRVVLGERQGVSEKRMFGGIAFTIGGHMCVGIVKDELMVRVGKDAHEHLVRQPHARPMDFTGRPMKGFLYVASPGLERDVDLERWVERGVEYAISLPAKPASGTRVPSTRAVRRKAPRQATRRRADR